MIRARMRSGQAWSRGEHRAISVSVSRSHLILVAVAVGVLGFGMYLLHAVRASPASVTAVTGDQPAPPAPPAEREAAPKLPDSARPGIAAHSGGLTGSHSPMAPRPADPEHPPLHPTVDPTKPHPNLEAMMDEANKQYDAQEYDQAKTLASKVLESLPGNVRMMRILVSSYCADSEQDKAQAIYVQLPKHDREQMKIRCERSGVSFTDPPE